MNLNLFSVLRVYMVVSCFHCLTVVLFFFVITIPMSYMIVYVFYNVLNIVCYCISGAAPGYIKKGGAESVSYLGTLYPEIPNFVYRP